MVGHCVFSYRALYRALFGHWPGTGRALCFHTDFGSQRIDMLKILMFRSSFDKRGPFPPPPLLRAHAGGGLERRHMMSVPIFLSGNLAHDLW